MTIQLALSAENSTQQISPIPGGVVGSHTAVLSFQTAPSSGTAKVEYRLIGSTQWIEISSGLSLVSGETMFSFNGAVAALRTTFSGLSGGTSPIIWLSTNSSLNAAQISPSSGSMGAGGSQVVNVTSFISPMTATMVSSAVARKIELSTDGGSKYFEPEYDVTAADMLVVAIVSPVTNIKFTGASGDAFKVLP